MNSTNRYIHCLILLIVFITVPSESYANSLLLGETVNAGPATFEASLINPAQAVDMQKSQFSFFLAPGYQMGQNQWPGVEPQDNTGVAIDLGQAGWIPAGGVYKVNKNLAVGLSIPVFLPQFQVPILTELPILILGQNTKFSHEIKAGGLAFNGFAALKIMKKLNLGIHVLGGRGSFEGPVKDSSGSTIIDVKGSALYGELRVGMKFKLSNKISLGASSVVARLINVNAEFTPNLAAPIEIKNTSFLNSASAGIKFSLGKKLTLLGDVQYVKAIEKGISLVDLAEQPADSSPAISGGVGVIYKMNAKTKLLAGANLKSSNLGPGEPGGGTTGFGGMFALGAPATPYYQAGIGAELKLMKKTIKVPRKRLNKRKRRSSRKKRSRMRSKKVYPLAVTAGVAYRYHSVGIPASGEQPGSYEKQKILVPFSLTYKFH